MDEGQRGDNALKVGGDTKGHGRGRFGFTREIYIYRSKHFFQEFTHRDDIGVVDRRWGGDGRLLPPVVGDGRRLVQRQDKVRVYSEVINEGNGLLATVEGLSDRKGDGENSSQTDHVEVDLRAERERGGAGEKESGGVFSGVFFSLPTSILYVYCNLHRI